MSKVFTSCLIAIAILAAVSTQSSATTITAFNTTFEYAGGNPVAGNDAANLNGATGQIGTWSGVLPNGAGGQFAPEFVGFLNNNKNAGQLMSADRPDGTSGAIVAHLSQDVSLDGAEVTFDLAVRRTQTGNQNKSFSIIGRDAGGVESFHLRVNAQNNQERLGVVTDNGATTSFNLNTVVGADANEDLNNPGGNNGGVPDAAEIATIMLNLTETGYTITFDRDTRMYVTEEIAYNQGGLDLDRINFTFDDVNDNNNSRTGYMLGNFSVTGNVIPEPTTGLLALLGVAAAGVRRRRVA